MQRTLGRRATQRCPSAPMFFTTHSSVLPSTRVPGRERHHTDQNITNPRRISRRKTPQEESTCSPLAATELSRTWPDRAPTTMLLTSPAESRTRTASALQSKHVVRIIDVAEQDAELPYIAMERLSGADLAHELRHKALSVREVQKLVDEVGAVLDLAREKGIVHRDIKPQNLLLRAGLDGHPFGKCSTLASPSSTRVQAPYPKATLSGPQPTWLQSRLKETMWMPKPISTLWQRSLIAASPVIHRFRARRWQAPSLKSWARCHPSCKQASTRPDPPPRPLLGLG